MRCFPLPTQQWKDHLWRLGTAPATCGPRLRGGSLSDISSPRRSACIPRASGKCSTGGFRCRRMSPSASARLCLRYRPKTKDAPQRWTAEAPSQRDLTAAIVYDRRLRLTPLSHWPRATIRYLTAFGVTPSSRVFLSSAKRSSVTSAATSGSAQLGSIALAMHSLPLIPDCHRGAFVATSSNSKSADWSSETVPGYSFRATSDANRSKTVCWLGYARMLVVATLLRFCWLSGIDIRNFVRLCHVTVCPKVRRRSATL